MRRHWCRRWRCRRRRGRRPEPNQQRAFDIYKELIEINTVTATGDTAKAAEAMAARLRAGGFPDADVHVFSPAPRKGNLVARLRGTGARKPILLLAHIDVVPASREDWSTDPFKLVEQDGYFYARGSGDDHRGGRQVVVGDPAWLDDQQVGARHAGRDVPGRPDHQPPAEDSACNELTCARSAATVAAISPATPPLVGTPARVAQPPQPVQHRRCCPRPRQAK